MTREENELLCRVTGDARMGQLMRRHWMPACLAEELAEPDGAPVRILLLGEELVAFRDTNGRIGVLDEHCPHRRASLVLGRNEECGLRCLYHGWKVDVDGNILEMASEAGAEMLALARLACDVPDEIDDAPVFAAIRELINIHDDIHAVDPSDRRRLAFLILALTTARTPDVPIPALASR